MNNLVIIYVGPLNKGGTCLQRAQAFIDLGYKVTMVDTLTPYALARQSSLLGRMKNRLIGQRDYSEANKRIIELTFKNHPDILWIDKGILICPETLLQVKKICSTIFIVSYSPDDMMNPRNQSRNYLRSIPLYNLHVTTKSYNVIELKKMGAREVLFVDNAFSPEVHRPFNLYPSDRERFGFSVGFIGDYEKERENSMFILAQTGFHVRIWGPNWYQKQRRFHSNMQVEGRPLWGDDYAKTICATDINLCFLRKVNRDLQTTRSIEIPACGGFMLAERTDEHLKLFEEGKEAEFFSSNQELLNKVKYYLSHEEERKQIAQAGRERCLRSGYSNQERIREMLLIVDSLKKAI